MRYSFRSPLTIDQSRSLLNWCIREGATLFTVNFLFVKGEDSESLCNAFYDRMEPFAAGIRLLECVEGNGFELQSSFHLNQESLEQILRETSGNLFRNSILYLPEDWLFYIEDLILLQIVNHEDSATIRVNEQQYRTFDALGIPHQAGCSEWSGLTEEPVKRKPVRIS